MERQESYRFESALEPVELLEWVGRVADQWDGEWEPADGGGRLGLPVTAGLKRGWLAGRLEVAPQPSGSAVRFEVDKGEMKSDRGSVMILLVGAFGGLVTVVAPFVPALWAMVPVGLLLGFSAWFMVVARLRSAGPAEFFAQVDDEAEAISTEPISTEPRPED
ncbi:MAG: hypothetical protein AAFY88_01220 [Acidobacteriota bacterium]